MVIGSQGKVVNICICGKCDLSIALEQTTTEEQNFIIINSSRNSSCAKNKSLVEDFAKKLEYLRIVRFYKSSNSRLS